MGSARRCPHPWGVSHSKALHAASFHRKSRRDLAMAADRSKQQRTVGGETACAHLGREDLTLRSVSRWGLLGKPQPPRFPGRSRRSPYRARRVSRRTRSGVCEGCRSRRPGGRRLIHFGAPLSIHFFIIATSSAPRGALGGICSDATPGLDSPTGPPDILL